MQLIGRPRKLSEGNQQRKLWKKKIISLRHIIFDLVIDAGQIYHLKYQSQNLTFGEKNVFKKISLSTKIDTYRAISYRRQFGNERSVSLKQKAKAILRWWAVCSCSMYSGQN